ncbi:HNH endonuclease [Geomonas sp. Red32]|uniref:HNH endonuclease n=1 Tax=Geomonas sp. Red32 TaxID=2912856 RepID=UPI0033130618
MLWGRSGNLCAICRQRLVVDETELDSESVVGDECHIISGAPNGPRHEPTFPADEIDDISNLLLLCRVHHKMVDDQFETYSAELLRNIKASHEKWVESKLKGQEEIAPVRIRRFKNEIPTHLPAVTSGKDLFNLASDCHGSYQNYSDDLSDEEVETVGGFLQNLQDWIDICGDLQPIDKVRATKSIDDEIKVLNTIGFVVFAGIEIQRMEGGVGNPSTFKVLHISVIRRTDPSIISVNDETGNLGEGDGTGAGC